MTSRDERVRGVLRRGGEPRIGVVRRAGKIACGDYAGSSVAVEVRTALNDHCSTEY
jgi:hypothetical protein